MFTFLKSKEAGQNSMVTGSIPNQCR